MTLSFKPAALAASIAFAALSTPSLAAPDLITRSFDHDDRCLPDSEAFSLKRQTVFERGFHGGDVDIEAGKARFSLWGAFMDFARVSVSDSSLRLKKIDTRSGPHNVTKGCPAEYATLTFELQSTPHISGTIDATLIVVRNNDTWRVPLSVRSAPARLQVQWDRIPGSGAATSTGATRPIQVRNPGGCTPGTPGCGGSPNSVQATPGGPAASPGGGAVTSHVFASLRNCLRNQGGDATLEGTNKLIVKVPRDAQVNCQEKVRADARATEQGVDLFADAGPDRYVTRITRVVPGNDTYFYGVTDEDEFVVGFKWDSIRERFRPLGSAAPPRTVSPPIGNAVAERAGTQRPALPPPSIEAQIETRLNGRTHAPLSVRIEEMR
jgi:hypothetical protein